MVDEQEGPYTHLKPLRKVLILLLVAFSLVWLGLSMLTLNFLRHPLEEHFGDKIRIKGDITLGMDGLRPTIVVNDILAGTFTLKRAELRIPFSAPGPGNSIETRLRLGALALPSRPPIDADLPLTTDMHDSAVNNFEARAGDSLLAGSISYRGRELDANLSATKLDYGLLYPGASGGAAEGTLTVQGSGGSQLELAPSLRGHLVLAGGKGKVPGRALALWGGSLLGALLPNDATVNCAVAEFDMHGGIATVTRLGVDTDSLNITGTGTVDFNAMEMNMVFTPQPKVEQSINTAVPLGVSGAFGEVTAEPVGAPVAVNAAAPSPCVSP